MNTVSTIEAAERLGLSESTLQRYARRGCPHDRDGRFLRFDIEAVHQWMAAQRCTGRDGRPADADDPDLAEAQRRKAAALARKYEIQVAIEEGRMVPADAVRTRWANIARVLRNGLQNMGGQIAPRLVGMTEQQIADALDAEVQHRLQPLAGGAADIPANPLAAAGSAQLQL